jgi:predicted type IV restriction endonuclease
MAADEGILAGIELALQPNYLGSPEVITKLVSKLFDARVKCYIREATDEDVHAAANFICTALSEDTGEFVRMPDWHTPEQLGSHVIKFLDLDANYLADENLFCIVSEGLANVCMTIDALLKAFQADPHAEWDPDGLLQLNKLLQFVVTVLLGTTELFLPGRRLGSFTWQPVSPPEPVPPPSASKPSAKNKGASMIPFPSKVTERIRTNLKKYQPIVASAKSRDVNESDTVVIVADLLQEIFGYDKYSDITSEHMIKNTFCDLAVKVEGKLSLLIEVKAIGLELKDTHVKQAIDYAANQGCDWVALTNGAVWRVYKVIFGQPIEHEVVVEFELLTLNPKTEDHVELLAAISKEGWKKAHLEAFHEHKQALSRFTLAAILNSEPVIKLIRRELRRLVDVLVDEDDIITVLNNEVIKREALEGEKAVAAKKRVAKAAAKAAKPQAKPDEGPEVASSDPA